jgi:hypothetical protein
VALSHKLGGFANIQGGASVRLMAWRSIRAKATSATVAQRLVFLVFCGTFRAVNLYSRRRLGERLRSGNLCRNCGVKGMRLGVARR